MYKSHFLILVILTIIFISPNFLFGQSGKISGTVVDSTTNEPLVGANVIIVGTNMGAATDFNGKYFIINVPSGTYSLSASEIGYTKVVQQDVIVNIDRTTNIDFNLRTAIYVERKLSYLQNVHQWKLIELLVNR